MVHQSPLIAAATVGGVCCLIAIGGCSSSAPAPPSPSTSAPPQESPLASPSTANTPTTFPKYKIRETFVLTPGLKCRVDWVRYGPKKGRNQNVKIKLWQQNNTSKASEGCTPYRYVDVTGADWDMMACLSPQPVTRGVDSYFSNYVHKCTFPAGTQLAEIYFMPVSGGRRAIVTL